MQQIPVLVTVAGRDRPGVVAAVFSCLASHDVDVLDVEHVVIRDRSTLAVLVDLGGDPMSLRHSLSTTCGALGLESEVTVLSGDHLDADQGGVPDLHVILLGRPMRAGAIGEIAACVAESGGNICSIRQLSVHPIASLDLIVRGADEAALRSELVVAAHRTGLDIAVERAGLHRRAKRLVVLDVDSTLVQGEAIDELAKIAGVQDEVSAITTAAMAGELEFAESLAARVRLLAGLPLSAVHQVRDAMELTPGARTLVHTLKRLGFVVGIVSGGFSILTDRFVDELGLDCAAANTLEILDGVVTGRTLGPIIDRAGKATALREFATQFGVPLPQTVAIGDGANDIDMLQLAGLGIAFNAKPVVGSNANVSVNQPFLDVVLHVLGVSAAEIEATEAIEIELESAQ